MNENAAEFRGPLCPHYMRRGMSIFAKSLAEEKEEGRRRTKGGRCYHTPGFAKGFWISSFCSICAAY